MGQKLIGYFAEAEKLAGMMGKLQLAGMTKITSGQANTLQDSPELCGKFESALAELRRTTKPQVGRESVTVAGDVGVLRRHIQLYLEMVTQRSLILGDMEQTVRRVDEGACQALDVARVSIWWVDEARTKITCADLFERGSGKHSAGLELFAKDFAPYFQALGHEKTIAAHDAHKDPRTSCFSEVYLKPLGINSMLDVPIWADGKMIGVLCAEHVGPSRSWNEDEERCAYLMSSFVALAAERKLRA